jgi:hypothetical protein
MIHQQVNSNVHYVHSYCEIDKLAWGKGKNKSIQKVEIEQFLIKLKR